MNTTILNTDIQNFINANLATDHITILLKSFNFKGVTNKELVQQIEAKIKCKDKLPTWFGTPNIYYPNKLNIEQTSSEGTAQFKAGLVNGKSLLDMTGGFGVDSYFFSHCMEEVHHCEMDEKLSQIAAYNFKILGRDNITAHNIDGVDYLIHTDTDFDWVFLDPSRRHDAKGKVFLLSDCLPNVPENLNSIFRRTKNIMIKTSPLLDLSAGLKELGFVREIHIIAIKNEVKEILWILEKSHENDVLIKTTNLLGDSTEQFNFLLNDEKLAVANFSNPQEFLYEPNSAILKSGAFKAVGNIFELYKLHDHSHLYTNNQLSEFPGRRFKIVNNIPFNKKEIQKLNINKANITMRNFPMTVAEIRKKYKIKDGGEVYLFFTTNAKGEKIIIQCRKI